MVRRVLILLGFLLISSFAQAKGLSASVDRMQVGIGEQVELTVTLSGIRGQRPEISGLLKEFSIDSQSQSQSVQIINGIVSKEVRWVFLMTPNRKGDVTIPEFKVGRFSSDAINIKVTDMPVAQSSSDDVLMEVDLSPEGVYVQSQVAYVQRLYFSRSLVGNASISTPKLSKGDADIQFWGSSDARNVVHNNRQYQLIERYYLVYPRKAGVLEFEPSVFNGSLASNRRRNDFQMNGFRRGTRATAYSEKASIQVKDTPKGYPPSEWLPASQISLSVNFSQPLDTLSVGEPVTVTVGLMAEGLKAEVLPEIKLDLPENVKSYPEKSQFRTDKVANGMVGLRQEKVVLVANEAGEYIIPEIRVPWWSVTEDKQKFAIAKSVVLKVTGDTPALPLSKSMTLLDNKALIDESQLGNSLEKENSESQDEDKANPEKSEAGDTLLVSQQSGLLELAKRSRQGIVAIFLILVSILGFGIILWRRRKRRVNSSEYQQGLVLNRVTKSLEEACKESNLKLAITRLPTWADAVGIYPATLAGIEAAGNAQLSEAVKNMTAASYSPNPVKWDGGLLVAATKQYASTGQSKRASSAGLTPLHPV